MTLLLDGLDLDAIAQRLGISRRTLASHCSRILGRLRVTPTMMITGLGLLPVLNLRLIVVNRSEWPQTVWNSPRVILDAPTVLDPLSHEVAWTIYRIVDEALKDLLRPLSAGRCVIRIFRDEHRIAMSIEADNGGAKATLAGGWLQTMRNRANELGGTLAVESDDPAVIRIVADLPLDRGLSA